MLGGIVSRIIGVLGSRLAEGSVRSGHSARVNVDTSGVEPGRVVDICIGPSRMIDDRFIFRQTMNSKSDRVTSSC